jgi:hypothetical protein
MSSKIMAHLPKPGRINEGFDLTVDGDIQPNGTAALNLHVLGDFDITVFATEPEHLRAIATAAAELADRLDSAQVVASYLKPVTA